MKQAALPPTLPPRLLNREGAAAYTCVSLTKFDEMVEDGRMPQPKRIDRRKVWDVRALDTAIDALPTDEETAADETWGDVDAA